MIWLDSSPPPVDLKQKNPWSISMALFQNHPDKNSDPQNQEMAPTKVMQASFNTPPKQGNGQKEV